MIRMLLDMGPDTFWILLVTNGISIGILWFTSQRELLKLERAHREDLDALRAEYELDTVRGIVR